MKLTKKFTLLETVYIVNYDKIKLCIHYGSLRLFLARGYSTLNKACEIGNIRVRKSFQALHCQYSSKKILLIHRRRSNSLVVETSSVFPGDGRSIASPVSVVPSKVFFCLLSARLSNVHVVSLIPPRGLHRLGVHGSRSVRRG